jgi:hypothetical protein
MVTLSAHRLSPSLDVLLLLGATSAAAEDLAA